MSGVAGSRVRRCTCAEAWHTASSPGQTRHHGYRRGNALHGSVLHLRLTDIVTFFKGADPRCVTSLWERQPVRTCLTILRRLWRWARSSKLWPWAVRPATHHPPCMASSVPIWPRPLLRKKALLRHGASSMIVPEEKAATPALSRLCLPHTSLRFFTAASSAMWAKQYAFLMPRRTHGPRHACNDLTH